MNEDVYLFGGLLGANMYAYCGSNAVNMFDPTGYWSKDIHWGNNGTSSIYGTYKWARLCEISVEHSKIIANANHAQDNIFNSAFTSKNNYKKHLRAHGAAEYANDRFWSAVGLWKNNKKTDALKELGKALHAVQDYYAHLDWNVDEQKAVYHKSWRWVYKNKKWQWESGNSYFDNVDYYVYRGTGVNRNFYFHEYVGRVYNPRYIVTRDATILWINCFIKEAKYKQ